MKYSKFHPEMSITELLLHFARRSISPNKSCCVVTTVRNEGIYIIEWIAHYLSLGFESIFIYSNDNSDGSDDLLYYLQSKGIIKLIKNEVSAGSDAQSKAYSDALMFNNDILDYAWCLFVDMDEFIVVNTDRFNNIKSFLLWHEQKEVDAICINWTYVGSGGNVSWFDAPM
ncbi:glycosyltransferase family 2 protein, partial [Acetobacter pomorum]|uniref:glycosyltransferase family 2 protein n=1 Tax=Acetobacter pomorum TaxID=65959 RepID=UPI0022303463